MHAACGCNEMASDVYFLFLILICKKHADIIDPLVKSNWSSEDVTPVSVLFWRRYYSWRDWDGGAIDRLSPVSASDVNGADRVAFSFFETERPGSLLRTDFYEVLSLSPLSRVINVEMTFPRV